MSDPVYPPQQQPSAYGGNPYGGNTPYPPQQPPAFGGNNPYPPSQYGAAIPPPSPGGYNSSVAQNHVTINVQQGGTTQPPLAEELRAPPEAETDNMEFGTKSIRLGFIRKVYGILACQLVVTFGIACIFFFPESVKKWTYDNPGLMFGSWVASFVLIIVLICVPNLRRKAPQNYIVLLLFTACEGVMLGTICAYYDTDDVLKAIVATVVIVVGLTLFAFQTKIDFTMSAGLLFSFLWGLIIFGIMAAIFQSEVLNTMYAAMGAMLFSAYIVVDTQMIIGGKHKLSISPEEYVFAALNLYLDIINLFLMLLRIFGGGNN